MAHRWGYGPDDGPHHWSAVAPAALGHHQSPIQICAASAEYCRTISEQTLKFSYDPFSCKALVNNGRQIQITCDSANTNLKGGPLKDCEYVLKQFHFHWGSHSGQGSEHVVDETVYAAELHLVHWNKTQFPSFEDAVHSENGLAVLAVFLEAGNSPHLGLKPLTDLLSKVEYADDTVSLEAGFDITSILPDDVSRYWTYQGSLTTPPCFESVRFIIFKEAISVSESQLAAFRSLKQDSRQKMAHNSAGKSQCCHLVDNFRPVMPLNGRTVNASFRKFFA